MGLNRDSFKKMFPNLAKEMESEENKVDIGSVRTDDRTGERAVADRYACYEPDVIDFIRRCDTCEQAEEIIFFLERKGELQKVYAQKLRRQLKKEGVRSFGPKKEHDYYLKHGGRQAP